MTDQTPVFPDKIEPAPYDIFVTGLRLMREKDGKILSLEETRDLVLNTAGTEHIPLIKAAYEELKKQERE